MSDNEFDPEDVVASTGITMVVRVLVFFASWVLGHGIGLFASKFAKFGDLLKVATGEVPSPGEMLTELVGTLVPVMFMGIFSGWLIPWAVIFLYFASQFLLVEGGWERWFPWLAVGQAVCTYLVLDNYGVGAVFLILGVGAVIAGWKLLEAKLHERRMQRFDSIEAENRRKRRAKGEQPPPAEVDHSRMQ